MKSMHLIKPTGSKKRYTLRFRNWDGRWRKLYAFEARGDSVRLGERIKLLINARINGDPPPAELGQWIDALPQKMFGRLVELELLDRKRREGVRPVGEHVDAWEKLVAARMSNTAKHAKQQAARVRRLVEAQHCTRFVDWNLSDALVHLKEWELSATTRRHYLVAMRDFCAWMVRDRRATENPMQNFVLPPNGTDLTRLRRPLTIEQVRKLFKHLDDEGDTLRPHQQSRWTAYERKLVYWVAIQTGLRVTAIASLRRGDLLLDETPTKIRSLATYQKNKQELFAGIRDDLAQALREYASHMHPEAKLFSTAPSTLRWATALRRDLEEAEIPTSYDRGDGKKEIVDFHALRATAIVLLLRAGVDQLTVARQVGLKTLRLVELYARQFRIEDYSWQERLPAISIDPDEEGQADDVG